MSCIPNKALFKPIGEIAEQFLPADRKKLRPLKRTLGNTITALCPKCGMGTLRPMVIVNGLGNIIRFIVIAFNHKLAFDTS